MKKVKLKDRFEDFIKTLDGYESIDQLLADKHVKKKRADYFLANQSVIVEQKSLETKLEDKVLSIVEDLIQKYSVPTHSRMTIEDLYSHVPNDILETTLFEKVTKGVDDIVASANRQIVSTQEIFELEDSYGILVILNEDVPTLSIDVLAVACSKMFHKTNDKGDLRYQNIAAVLVIQETHSLSRDNVDEALPLMAIYNSNHKDEEKARITCNQIREAWSKFNNATYNPSEENLTPANLKTMKLTELNSEK